MEGALLWWSYSVVSVFHPYSSFPLFTIYLVHSFHHPPPLAHHIFPSFQSGLVHHFCSMNVQLQAYSHPTIPSLFLLPTSTFLCVSCCLSVYQCAVINLSVNKSLLFLNVMLRMDTKCINLYYYYGYYWDMDCNYWYNYTIMMIDCYNRLKHYKIHNKNTQMTSVFCPVFITFGSKAKRSFMYKHSLISSIIFLLTFL